MSYFRTAVLCLLMSTILSGSCHRSTVADKERPNILILLADDLGYGDLGCYGGVATETPHIDALAAEGMKFNHFYAASAVCSPARASILTGKFPIRMDIRQAFTETDGAHLPMEEVILPELLRDKGYFSSVIGKWHLGGNRPHHIDAREKGEVSELPGPLQQGFDHYLTTIEGEPPRQTLIRERRMYAESGKYLVRNDKRIPPVNKQWDEIKVDEAIHLMDSCRAMDKPFFIHLCFDAPHEPYEPAPDPFLSDYRKRGIAGDQLYFRSRVAHLDAQIGRVVEALKEKGLYERTLILFTSDNGAIREGSTGPFKGGKTDLHEGGLRVPFIAVWKGKVAAFSVNHSVTHHADILPTICDLLGLPLPEGVDGVSMRKALNREYVPRKKPMFFQLDKYLEFQGHGPRPVPHITTALVDGSWKYTTDGLQPAQLFNLDADYREDHNVLEEQPEIARRMQEQTLLFWNAPRNSPYKN